MTLEDEQLQTTSGSWKLKTEPQLLGPAINQLLWETRLHCRRSCRSPHLRFRLGMSDLWPAASHSPAQPVLQMPQSCTSWQQLGPTEWPWAHTYCMEQPHTGVIMSTGTRTQGGCSAVLTQVTANNFMHSDTLTKHSPAIGKKIRSLAYFW